MPVIKQLTLLSIIELLARNYPHVVWGKEIVAAIGKDRRDDVEKCLFYLMGMGYVLSALSGMKIQVGEITPVEDDSYRLTASGIEYLDKEIKRIAEILEKIEREPPGFRPGGRK